MFASQTDMEVTAGSSDTMSDREVSQDKGLAGKANSAFFFFFGRRTLQCGYEYKICACISCT
jgi:hypothetical protein